jgi:dienelactone hydrolase
LSPHGHWDNGNMHPVPQSRDIGLAQKGYVVYAPDTVHTDTAAYFIGLSSLTIQIWNDFRAVDFLVSLPEVDKDKIGCTGASGGGMQTMFAMALDDRIKVAVPAVYVSYYQKIMNPDEWAHCICNWAPGVLSYTDEPEIAAMFAPKPTLFLCVTGDWTAKVPKEEFPEMKRLWALFGAADKVDVKQYDSGHDYSKPMREWMYAWFNKYLKGIDDPEAAKEPDIKTEDLATMKALDVPALASSFDKLPAFFKDKYGFKVPNHKSAVELKANQSKVRKGLNSLLNCPQGVTGRAERAEVVNVLGLQSTKLRIRTEPEIVVPALLFLPSKSKPNSLVVVLSSMGKKAIVDKRPDVIVGLLEGGAAVLLPDVRLTGELGRNWDWNTVHWGRPELGMALTDIRACLNSLSARDDLRKVPIGIVGLDDAGVTALVVGALEPKFAAVAIDNLGKTYAEGRMRPLVPNLARLCDLPQIAAAISPRPLIIGGVGAGFKFAGNHALTAMPSASLLESRPISTSRLVQEVVDALKGGAR